MPCLALVFPFPPTWGGGGEEASPPPAYTTVIYYLSPILSSIIPYLFHSLLIKGFCVVAVPLTLLRKSIVALTQVGERLRGVGGMLAAVFWTLF